jgi:hypothetical protein
MATCLIPAKVEEFKKDLKERKLDLIKLFNMSSEARTKVFERYAGENASKVNLEFEKKLILKNRIKGIENWIEKQGELGRYHPNKKSELNKILQDYKDKQAERVFSPKENEAFLADLAESKIGTRITEAEASNMFKLSSKAEDLLSKFNEETGTWSSPKAKAEYGASKVALEKYVEDLKSGKETFKDLIKGRVQRFKQEAKDNQPLAVTNLLTDTIKSISDNSVSLVATLDNSFLGRQGLNTLKTHPSIWWEQMVKKSFSDYAKTIGGENALDALWADIYSNPLYISGELTKAKVIPKTEEQFPSSLPEKIPVVGKAFKASENAFLGSGLRGRVKLYELYRDIAKENGVELNNIEIESIGRLVNSLTARGQWGKKGEPAAVRLVLWAPKMIKSHLDNLLLHPTGASGLTPFARKQAQINLLKIIASTAVVLGTANALQPGSAELDPRSSKAGKIVIGNGKKAQSIAILLDLIGLNSTTYSNGDVAIDTTGGAGSIITLASRLALSSSKNSATGVVTPLGGGYGKTSGFDLAVDFLANKTTPVAHAIIDILKGEKFGGVKPTVANTMYGLTTPISVQNFINLLDDRVPGTDWGESEAKEIIQFKKKVGENSFKKANNEFNQQFNNWLSKVKKDSRYQTLSEEDKQKLVTNKKAQIKKDIFRQYGFIYKSQKSKPLPKL